jgi:hypothetical protein
MDWQKDISFNDKYEAESVAIPSEGGTHRTGLRSEWYANYDEQSFQMPNADLQVTADRLRRIELRIVILHIPSLRRQVNSRARTRYYDKYQ